MTRGNARELAVHLIYGRDFTGEEPEQVIATRLEKEYYAQLSQENQVYSDRPSHHQMNYIDTVVTGVANRAEELNAHIQKHSIDWDVSRISRLARTIMWRSPKLCELQRCMMGKKHLPLSTASWALLPEALQRRLHNERNCIRYKQLYYFDCNV